MSRGTRVAAVCVAAFIACFALWWVARNSDDQKAATVVQSARVPATFPPAQLPVERESSDPPGAYPIEVCGRGVVMSGENGWMPRNLELEQGRLHSAWFRATSARIASTVDPSPEVQIVTSYLASFDQYARWSETRTEPPPNCNEQCRAKYFEFVSPALVAMVERAKTTQSDAMYRAAMWSCAIEIGGHPACAELDADKLVQLERSNAVNWLLVARKRADTLYPDAKHVNQALEYAVNAPLLDAGTGLFARTLNPYVHQIQDELARMSVVDVILSLDRDRSALAFLPNFVCDAKSVSQPERRSLCDALGRRMMQNSSMELVRLGAQILDITRVDPAKSEAAQREVKRLAGRFDAHYAGPKDRFPFACEDTRKRRRWLDAVAQFGSAEALRRIEDGSRHQDVDMPKK